MNQATALADLRASWLQMADDIVEWLPTLQDLTQAPNVPHPEANVGGATRSKYDHSDPTLDQAMMASVGKTAIRQAWRHYNTLQSLHASIGQLVGHDHPNCDHCDEPVLAEQRSAASATMHRSCRATLDDLQHVDRAVILMDRLGLPNDASVRIAATHIRLADSGVRQCYIAEAVKRRKARRCYPAV